MLLGEMQAVNAKLRLETSVMAVSHDGDRFRVTTSGGVIEAGSLVVATGGKSIPKMGATGFAYQIAEQFGLKLIETRPGLVPLTLDPASLEKLSPLAGVAVTARFAMAKPRSRKRCCLPIAV